MNTLKYKNRTVILSFIVFSLISLVLLPFYHIHTEIEHVYLQPHKHQAHQHICLIESFVSQLSGGSIDKDCEDSHEEEEAQTNMSLQALSRDKSQYVIKQGGDLTKDLTPPLLYTVNAIKFFIMIFCVHLCPNLVFFYFFLCVLCELCGKFL